MTKERRPRGYEQEQKHPSAFPLNSVTLRQNSIALRKPARRQIARLLASRRILWIQLQHTTRIQAGMVIIALGYERVRICQQSPYLPGPKGRKAEITPRPSGKVKQKKVIKIFRSDHSIFSCNSCTLERCDRAR
jgi:hypothetical protein